MKIVGLVGSARKNGNTAILVKETLDHCRQLGADVALCQLSDLLIRPCIGCYNCLLAREKCPVDDDMPFFLDTLGEADGVVLGYPTYVYNIPGILKMIQDRVWMLAIHPYDKIRGKKGIVLTSGNEKLGFALPTGELFLKTFLIDVVCAVDFPNSFLPGTSVLNNRSKTEGLRSNALSLVEAIKKGTLLDSKTSCPFCDKKIIQLIGIGKVECPICKRKGVIENDIIHWSVHDYSFDPEFLTKHFIDKTSATTNDFIVNRQQYFNLLEKYKDKNVGIEWITKETSIKKNC